MRTLLSVDDAVRSLLDDLEARGELENTLVVLTSDNGYLMGEHRVFQRKEYAFEAAQPTAWIAGPDFRSGATSDAFVTNLDLAPTIVETTGATSGLTMDGRSIQDVLAEPDLGRDRFLPIYIPLPPPRPAGHATRTSRYKYVSYNDGTEELYDLFVDPYEETDVSDEPSYASVRVQLRAARDGEGVFGQQLRCERPSSAAVAGLEGARVARRSVRQRPTRWARTSDAQRPRSGWGGTRAGVAAAQPPPKASTLAVADGRIRTPWVFVSGTAVPYSPRQRRTRAAEARHVQSTRSTP